LILEVVENYLNSNQRLLDAIRNKFVKRLLSFYMPSKLQFVNQEWTSEKNCFTYAKIGYLLIKILLRYKEGKKILSGKNKI
jgi:hypothetical protein